ncbi:MAG: dTDP-4-dehydrorhamnose reductase [Pedosphaera sp.]|nr:dTDP-4-dehydrorhamnose reductase [Pedosphaera sp.]
MNNSQPSSLEVWGGVECTINRIWDRYFDQFERSGHGRRITDLDLFAELGIRALRYPVSWEKHSSQPVDWSWADERLHRLRDYHIEPIVGLVHHGSGPPHTSLLDPNFPSELAVHASAVAQRYPWIKYYNPVNEPLTTARFSCLYGHWYPHKKDLPSFARALLLQCDAVRQSMRAIRKINPEAQLVQTEDMGKTFSTRLLAYQAEFENERRWLSLDLLSGRFDSGHRVWDYIRHSGVTEAELKPFQDEPCPPDIIGINHYVASERFLDERLERYPTWAHGGNGRHAYADVAAVRVCANGTSGPYGILKDAWERFHLPVAVTEAHLGCTREEQLRWLMEVWFAAGSLRQEGADIRAVTVWSLLGAYDWNSLLTRHDGYYESGAFDLRGQTPRPTAIAKCMRALAAGWRYRHPALANEGWWHRPQRLLYPPVRPYTGVNKAHAQAAPFRRSQHCSPKSILITGASGTLGQAFGRICEVRGLACRLVNRQEMDIAEPLHIREALEQTKPWAVINAAGYVKVDQAEAEPERCFRENVEGPIRLAEACKQRNLPFITFSSDLVFDGRHKEPYVEKDRINPLGVYGQSKAAAERKVLNILPQSLVVRTSCLFGPWDEHNFVTVTLRRLGCGEKVEAATNAVVSPTYLPDLVNACLDLLIDGEHGIWHLASPGAVSWAALAEKIAAMAGARLHLIEKKPLEELNLPARRPRYSVLGSERGQLLHPLDSALETYFAERRDFENRMLPPQYTPKSIGASGQE